MVSSNSIFNVRPVTPAPFSHQSTCDNSTPNAEKKNLPLQVGLESLEQDSFFLKSAKKLCGR